MDFFTLNDFMTGARFLQKITSFFRRPVSLEEARQTLQSRLENRKSDFLYLLRTTVYENRRSPYLGLLKNAGCEYGDLEEYLKTYSLEDVLRKLFEGGVYLSVNEFKGRQSVRRGNAAIQANPSLLSNPLTLHHLRAQSSGSGGHSVPVFIGLEFIRERAINHLLALESRGGRGWVHAFWGVPGNTDLVRALELTAMGSPPERWFSQVDLSAAGVHPRYRWSARLVRGLGRRRGIILPVPEFVPVSDPLPVIRWLTDVLERGKVPHLVTWASAAVRICEVASRSGIDLSHVQFSIGGEPITETRLSTIQRTGASAVPRFLAMECGYIAYGCLNPTRPDELHLFDDLNVTIQPNQKGPDRGLPPGALLISSLRRTAPFILLNVSLGDQAQFMSGSCGCRMEKLGWTTRIAGVRSFEKLTSAGMTVLDSDISRILEEVLPHRFGGSLLDYQLVEEEDVAGDPKLRLLISPSVGPLDPQAVREFFLGTIGSGSGAMRVMTLHWRESGIPSVERKPPLAGETGKVVHFLKLRR